MGIDPRNATEVVLRPQSKVFFTQQRFGNSMKQRLCLLATLILAPVFGFAQEPHTQSGIDWIEQSDRSFRLTVTESSLERILDTIGNSTSTRLHYPELTKEPRSLSCAGDILTILNCVLGDTSQNVMIRYRESGADRSALRTPEEIWILTSRESSANAEFAMKAEHLGTFVGLEAQSNPTRLAELRSREELDRLVRHLRSADPVARVDAITQLASAEQDEEALEWIEKALSDHDPAVRAQAVSTLASRGVANKAEILRQALVDEDAGVRLMALDYASEVPTLLVTMLGDPDDNVRFVANLKLKEVLKAKY